MKTPGDRAREESGDLEGRTAAARRDLLERIMAECGVPPSNPLLEKVDEIIAGYTNENTTDYLQSYSAWSIPLDSKIVIYLGFYTRIARFFFEGLRGQRR